MHTADVSSDCLECVDGPRCRKDLEFFFHGPPTMREKDRSWYTFQVEIGAPSALLKNHKGMLRALVDESDDRKASHPMAPPPRHAQA